MMASGDEQWRRDLREQLAQRRRDDMHMQRRWERYIRQRRFWPEPATTITTDSKPQRQPIP